MMIIFGIYSQPTESQLSAAKRKATDKNIDCKDYAEKQFIKLVTTCGDYE